MPGVVIRIGSENSASPMGYDTLVEADSENTKVEIKGEFESFFLHIKKFKLSFRW
jgi:hypothetical protein